jgi:TonB family protein
MDFLLAFFRAAAASAPAGPSDEAALRNARYWDVVLSQYPPRARSAGEQGPVGFRVALNRDGYATACEVTRSSGYPRLDEETCQLILTRGTFKGVSDENGRRVSAFYEGVLNWKLPDGAPAAPASVATAAAAAPEKLICRRKLRAGSLASFERTCLTRLEWRRLADHGREVLQELQGAQGSSDAAMMGTGNVP